MVHFQFVILDIERLRNDVFTFVIKFKSVFNYVNHISMHSMLWYLIQIKHLNSHVTQDSILQCETQQGNKDSATKHLNGTKIKEICRLET